MYKLLFMIFSKCHLTDDHCFYCERITYILNMQFYFLYIFLQANYIVPPGAQKVARQLLILKAAKFIANTYYVSFY